jgi:hypothetical protein
VESAMKRCGLSVKEGVCDELHGISSENELAPRPKGRRDGVKASDGKACACQSEWRVGCCTLAGYVRGFGTR